MPELAFAPSERRSYVLPILVALAILLAAATAVYLYLPRSTADIAITHIAVLPTHTTFQTGSKLVGKGQITEQDLYVLLTVRIVDQLRVPLFLSDITSTLTTADDAVTTTSAIEKNDLAAVTTAFPAIQPLTGPPLLRESTIQPHTPAQGMVLL
ncbi:MAG TPA: hypothetical protein VGU23_02760, partial [Acidobacteriaceae bacterium]|nr:hypothetical protein [Acidobacteriaceae bacterium]